MRKKNPLLMVAIIALLFAANLSSEAQTKPWVTAYYAGWEQGSANDGYLPTSEIDFTAMTVVDHMSLLPQPNGGLDSNSNGINQINSSSLISAAHATGTKVIVTVGAWATESNFVSSTTPSNLNTFVGNIVRFVSQRGYDGVDIDWEPIGISDTARFADLVRALRAALPSPRYLLTTTAGWGNPYVMFSRLQNYFDQINIMTYDLAFPSSGYNTWHNGCVYSNNVKVPGNGLPTPSCEYLVGLFESVGVQAEKLGIGSELGGFVWKGGIRLNGNGVTGPNQSWITPPTVTADVPLYARNGSGIMQKYYTPQRYHWDPGSQAAYLSIDNPGSSDDYFISYDDSNVIAAKIGFIKKRNLGGIILYELGMAYPGDGKFPLLKTIKTLLPPETQRRYSQPTTSKKSHH